MLNEPNGEMRYCSCLVFIGRTTPPPDYGKTIVIVEKGCTNCQQRGNLVERSEHE